MRISSNIIETEVEDSEILVRETRIPLFSTSSSVTTSHPRMIFTEFRTYFWTNYWKWGWYFGFQRGWQVFFILYSSNQRRCSNAFKCKGAINTALGHFWCKLFTIHLLISGQMATVHLSFLHVDILDNSSTNCLHFSGPRKYSGFILEA